MLNHITIMGRLTHDPELRRTQSGTPVVSFTLAVERDFKDDSGSRSTDFIDCVAWRNTAEFVSKYFTKGMMAIASGRLQIRQWKDKDGKHKERKKIYHNIFYGYCDSGNWLTSYCHGCEYIEKMNEKFPDEHITVTHWMPLPDPPKEVSKS